MSKQAKPTPNQKHELLLSVGMPILRFLLVTFFNEEAVILWEKGFWNGNLDRVNQIAYTDDWASNYSFAGL